MGTLTDSVPARADARVHGVGARMSSASVPMKEACAAERSLDSAATGSCPVASATSSRSATSPPPPSQSESASLITPDIAASVSVSSSVSSSVSTSAIVTISVTVSVSVSDSASVSVSVSSINACSSSLTCAPLAPSPPATTRCATAAGARGACSSKWAGGGDGRGRDAQLALAAKRWAQKAWGTEKGRPAWVLPGSCRVSDSPARGGRFPEAGPRPRQRQGQRRAAAQSSRPTGSPSPPGKLACGPSGAAREPAAAVRSCERASGNT
eukprot:scaffold77840_cov69-Phaeocystis_antarctica.AAC.6